MRNDGEAVAKVIVGLISMALGPVWCGYVLATMWAWFVAPLGVPRIGVAHAVGVALVVGYLTRHATTRDDNPSIGKAVGQVFLGPLLALGIGWIAHSFM